MPRLSPAQARRALRLSIVDGILQAIMVGVAESYLGALAVELGHRDTALAVLFTVPLLVGSSTQVFAGYLSQRLGGRKRLVVVGAALQALTHIGFVAIALNRSTSLLLLLAVKTAYWIFGLAVGPPWSAWMAAIVTGDRRLRYFARRSAVVQGTLLVAFAAAGACLHRASYHAFLLPTFAILHLVALLARLCSALVLAIQADADHHAGEQWHPLRRIGEAIRGTRWQTAVYVALLMFGAYLAVPFFTPYMLKVLRLDYAVFFGLTCITIATRMVLTPLFYPVTRRFGMRAVFGTSIAGISAVTLLWGISRSFAVLVPAQIVSGIAWGAFEYASFQLLLDCADEHIRVEFLALANALGGLAQLVGSLVGGRLLATNVLDYQQLFVVSAVGRILPMCVLFRLIRIGPAVQFGRLFFRVLSIRPSGGVMQRPIIDGLDDPPSAQADDYRSSNG